MKFLVYAEEDSVLMGIRFSRAFSAGVTVLETSEAAGRGEVALGELRSAGIHADLIVRKSDWLRALQVVTRAYRYDLTILTKLWGRGMTGLLFGGVPRALLADVRTNLLIVRPEVSRIRRVLLAVAAGPSRLQVLRWGGLVARAFDAQPVLLHVTDQLPAMFGGLPVASENLSQFMRSNTVEARSFQIAAQSLRLLEIEPELKLAHGDVVDELLAEARSGKYNLIVIGSSYAANASMRLFLEGVTDRLVQNSPCPILVVKGGTEA